MTKRLLIVSPTPFLPTDAGNRVRIHNMIDSMRGIGVEVFMLHVEREKGDSDGMAKFLGDGHFRSMPYTKPRRQENAFGRLRRQLYQLVDADLRHVWGVDDWYDPAITDAVLAWHAHEKFSAVLVEYVFLSALFEYLPDSVLKVLDTHDRFTLRHRLYLKLGMAPKFFSTTEDEEARGLNRADLILAIQEQEQAFFSRLTPRHVVTLGHLVTVRDCFVPDSGNAAPHLLVVGSENEINVDGLCRFLAEDWPALKAYLPASRLLIAGGGQASSVGGIASGSYCCPRLRGGSCRCLPDGRYRRQSGQEWHWLEHQVNRGLGLRQAPADNNFGLSGH